MSRPGYVQVRVTDEIARHLDQICETLGLDAGEHASYTEAIRFALRLVALGLVKGEDDDPRRCL